MSKKVIKFPELDAELEELKKLQATLRGRALRFKGGNEWMLKRIQLGESGLVKVKGDTLDFSGLSIVEFRENLQFVSPADRADVVKREIKKLRGIANSKYSRYKDVKDKFGAEAHNKISDFFENPNLTEYQKRYLREHYKNYNYEDDMSFSDFVDLYNAKGDEAFEVFADYNK